MLCGGGGGALDGADTPDGPGLGRRLLWIPLGLTCVGLGGLGIVLPGLPATVFFIAAAACFSKSSPRLEQWVLGLPSVGPLVRDYRAGNGMPQRAKVVAITVLSLAVGLSALALGSTPARVLLVAAGTIGVVVILRVPTSTRSDGREVGVVGDEDRHGHRG